MSPVLPPGPRDERWPRPRPLAATSGRTRRVASLATAGSLAALLALAAAALPACGKRGDPLPPLRKTPLPVAGLRLAQRGNQLELRCVAPRASLDGLPLPALQIEILRAEGEGDLEKVGQTKLVAAEPGGAVTDLVPLPPPGTTVRVAARTLAKGLASSRTAPVTLTVHPSPVAPTALAVSRTEAGVRIAWVGERPEPAPTPTPAATLTKAVPSPPASPSPGPAPAPSISPSASPSPPPFRGGFWVYRRDPGTAYDRPLSPRPLEERAFDDGAVPPGAEVCYVVRAVAGVDPVVESGDSNEVCLTLRDVTPPSPPTGLGVLAREGALEVSWSPSPESDLAAYRLHRASAGATPELVAEIPPGETFHLDRGVSPGVVYRYSLTAVDKAGNESAASAPADGRLR